MIENLLQLAEELARNRNLVCKRRAVSTAYYAAFHAAGKICSDTFIGSSSQTTEAYERVYRALDHAALRTTLTGELAAIGGDFILLWAERVRADYSPPARVRYSQSEVLEIIARARLVVTRLQNLDVTTRRLLAASLLFRNKRP